MAASALVALSFLLFAIDQTRESSQGQVRAVEGNHVKVTQAAIDHPNPTPAAERAREARHSQAREAIDDVNDLLVSPFSNLVDTNSQWAQRAVPGILGLLLYGLGGLMLANFIPQRRHAHTDWREATR